MASLAQKKTIIQILGEQYSSSQLLEAFEIVKYVFGKYGKKIYTQELSAVIETISPVATTIVHVLSKFDVCDNKGLQGYISQLKKQTKQNIDDLQVGEEHSFVVYTKGDEMYKRSLGRDLEKLLAKK